MPLRRLGFRTYALILAGLVAIGLVALHASYPLPYVLRVMVHQGPDFDDIHRFPARPIAASTSPAQLALSPNPLVAKLIGDHPDVDTLEALLTDSESSSFLVLHEGRIVEERYLLAHHRDTMQNSFSVSKSLLSALIGRAADAGLLDLADPVTGYLPELSSRDERFSEITIGHLLDMRSGIRYSREVSFPFVNQFDALVYYHPDLASVVLERSEIASAPGTFQYVNYNPPLLGLVLRRVTGLAPADYLARELWEPMGASRGAGWTIDDSGFERMESGFFATARDLARFGQLYLDEGEVSGRSVVPREWVAMTTDFPEHQELERYDGRAWGYRYGWWVIPRPEGRSDYCAIGHFGQFVYVSPQNEVVIVRTGPGRGEWGDRDWASLFYFLAERMGNDPSLHAEPGS